MGIRTTIYGYIEEMDFWLDPVKSQVRTHNSNVITSLPIADKWPPLSLEMFAICKNNELEPGPNFEYSGRIIHFGANLKSVECDWAEWKLKFEDLLTSLYFLEARVHLKTEYSSLETFSWRVDLFKYAVKHDSNMPDKIKKADWEYESTYD